MWKNNRVFESCKVNTDLWKLQTWISKTGSGPNNISKNQN